MLFDVCLFVVRCSVSLAVDRCLFLLFGVACCLLLDVCCLYVVCCLLVDVCCLLFIVPGSLFVARCVMCVECSVLYVVCCVLLDVRCVLFVVW